MPCAWEGPSSSHSSVQGPVTATPATSPAHVSGTKIVAPVGPQSQVVGRLQLPIEHAITSVGPTPMAAIRHLMESTQRKCLASVILTDPLRASCYPAVIRTILFVGVGATICSACATPPREARDPDPGAFHFVVESYNLNGDMWGNPSTLAA